MEPNEQKRLELIEEMIFKAKNRLSENGHLYLFWGWLVLIAGMGHFLLDALTAFQRPYLTWLVLMPLGSIYSVYRGIQMSKHARMKTYADELMAYIWTAFMFAIFILVFFMVREGNYAFSYPVMLLLYGIPTYISGGALKFRPLIIGGVACWVLAILAFFASQQLQLFLLLGGVVIAWLIPGYMLRNRYKAQSQVLETNSKTVVE